MKQKGEWGKWGVWLYPPKIPYLDLWTRDDDVIEEAVGSKEPGGTTTVWHHGKLALLNHLVDKTKFICILHHIIDTTNTNN